MRANLFNKIVLPISLAMIIGSIPIFYFINKSIKNTIDKATYTIINNDTAYIKETLELKYKILFFISNKSKESYDNNTFIAQQKIQELLATHFGNTKNIVFISTSKENIPTSKTKLNPKEMREIVKSKKEYITITSHHYIKSRVDFAPFDWKIYYLYNLDDKYESLLSNQAVIFSTILFLILLIFTVSFFVFKKYIKQPTTLLLKHFKNISDGKYNIIAQKFNIREIDDLIENFNLITNSIQTRENRIKENLQEAKSNSEYINNILNTQQSIIITKNNDEEITGVNNVFFKYFKKYKNLDDFKKDHSTITDFFIQEKDFIYKFKDKSWMDEIIKNPQATHKVKLDIDGKIHFFTISLVKSKEYNHILITLTDITDLENQKATLDQYDKIINKSLMVSRTNLDGKILYANEELLKVSKYSKEELIGKNEAILRSPQTPTKFYDDMLKTVQKEKIWSGQIEKIDKNGESFYVHLYLSPIVDANHKIIEYMYLRHNITDLITAQRKAKNAEESKSMFLASMSHEIRTPLNAIIGFTKILVKSNIELKYKNYVKTIDKSAENLLSILNDILDISKIENNSLVLEKAPFNPFEEFNSAVNLFYAKFNDKQISVECFIDPKIPQTLIGDALRIKQVLSNLISNAVKFTDEKGIIVIRADLILKDEKSCKINFSIKDSGIGIPKEKQAHIFTPFAQASGSTTRVFGGTGLGLDICSKIIKLHNSTIQLESQEGIGSKFSFTVNFQTKGDDSITSKVKNLQTCIVKFENDKYSTQYKNLKEYVNSTTKNIIINDTKNIELLKQQDIVFISEESIDDRVRSLAQSGVKFAIFSTKLNEDIEINNCSLLSSPIDVSQLFNIFIEVIDGTLQDKKINQEVQSNFKGLVLVAEDHQVNQELISILLNSRGVECVLANDGIEVMQEYKKDNFDLVLMDINMPKKNGIEATKDIREYEKEHDLVKTPIVALTANALEENKQQMLQSGMNGHLLKPIDENELNKVLGKYLKRDKKKESKNSSQEGTKQNEQYTVEKASQSMGIDTSMLTKIVKNFTQNIDSDMEMLSEAIKAKNFQEIANISHKIKGASLNLKMDTAGKFATKLETLAQQKIFQEVEENFKKLQIEVKYLKNYSDTL